jgi:hypothetical protein
MTTEKFFVYVQRLNSLIPAAALALILVLIGVDTIRSRFWQKEATIQPPTATKSETQQKVAKLDLKIRLSSIETDEDILILKVVTDTDGGSHDRYGEETRNLLFLRPSKEKAEWLFPYQTQALLEIDGLRGDSTSVKAIYAEVADRKHEGKSSKDAPVSVYLISNDGSHLEKILKDADSVLSHQLKGNVVNIIYQKDRQVRAARISLKDFAIQSDRVVASFTSAEKK